MAHDQPGLDGLSQSDLVSEHEPHDRVAGHPGEHIQLMLEREHGGRSRRGEPLRGRPLLNDVLDQGLPGVVVGPALGKSVRDRRRRITQRVIPAHTELILVESVVLHPRYPDVRGPVPAQACNLTRYPAEWRAPQPDPCLVGQVSNPDPCRGHLPFLLRHSRDIGVDQRDAVPICRGAPGYAVIPVCLFHKSVQQVLSSAIRRYAVRRRCRAVCHQRVVASPGIGVTYQDAR